MTSPERIMRALKYGFIVTGLLLIVVTVKVPAKTTHPLDQSIALIVVAIALLDLAFGIIGRRLMMRLTALNARAIQSAPLNHWLALNVASLGLINGCMLLAMVLHFMGGGANLVGLLFGVWLLALFFWSPTSPPAVERDASTSAIEPMA